MDKEKEELTIFKACLYALCGKDTKYYPRDVSGKWIDPADVFNLLPKDDPNPHADYEKHIALARASLDEVKGLTEYQDQKISRLLTIISFLTAAAGVVFTKFIDLYPLHDAIDRSAWLASDLLVIVTYALFFLFLLFVALGALVAFHASRTRFVWTGDVQAKKRKPKSYLFYRGIIESNADSWVEAFWDGPKPVENPSGAVDSTSNGAANSADEAADPSRGADNPSAASLVSIRALQFEYFKNCVGETYLIAAKVADKVRFLEPAQKLLSYAIRVLVVLLIVFAWTLVVIHPVRVTKSIDVPSAPAIVPMSRNNGADSAQTVSATTIKLEIAPPAIPTSNNVPVSGPSERRVEPMPSPSTSR